MFSKLYRGFYRGIVSEPARLVERGSFRGRSRRSHALVRIHDHLRYFLVLRGPELDGITRGALRRAQDDIERELGCIPLPQEGLGPSCSAPEHLENAKAIAEECLARRVPFREARIGRNVRLVCERESLTARGNTAHR